VSKGREISTLAKQLSDSQDGLCSTEFNRQTDWNGSCFNV